MSEQRYTRLKLRMLLVVVAGAAVASALGLFLEDVVIDGFLQNPFAQLFVWIGTHLFGQSTTAASLDAYQLYIRNYRAGVGHAFSLFLLMLVAFYLAMGRFTHWLEQIRSATARIADLSDQDVLFPKELAPLEKDLNAIRQQLQAREACAKAVEQRRGSTDLLPGPRPQDPPTSVVGYLTLLHDDPHLTPEQRSKFTGIALEKAQRLEELLGEFFDITRMDLGADTDSMVPYPAHHAAGTDRR